MNACTKQCLWDSKICCYYYLSKIAAELLETVLNLYCQENNSDFGKWGKRDKYCHMPSQFWSSCCPSLLTPAAAVFCEVSIGHKHEISYKICPHSKGQKQPFCASWAAHFLWELCFITLLWLIGTSAMFLWIVLLWSLCLCTVFNISVELF